MDTTGTDAETDGGEEATA
eukprot:gene27290-biopygen17803